MNGNGLGRLLTCLILACSLTALVGCGSTTTSASTSSATAASTSTTSASASTSSITTAAASNYTITRISGDPDWAAIPTLAIDNQPWGDPVDISAQGQICYNDDALYVRLAAREANIRAEYTADDVLGNPYEDSCLEFFFAPVTGDARYLNIEMNPNCCTCMEIGTARENRVRLAVTTDTLQSTATRTDDGWYVTYRVPFDLVKQLYPDFQAVAGGQMRGNLYKCGNLTVQKHYLTWNAMTSDKPDFHRPQDFGTLIFG